VWIFDYLPKETGIIVHRDILTLKINNLQFLIAHGDGLGPGETGYNLLKGIFTSKVIQWLYARIHPNAATSFAHWWSKQSRLSKDASHRFLGEDKEHLILFSKDMLKTEFFDYFIYGHRHLPFDFKTTEGSHIICLGDWFVNFTYAEFDGTQVNLINYPAEEIRK
jgi:UDP-2,3-diacylglucosamine hydrolase